MFVCSIQKELLGLVTNAYQYQVGQLSTVPALVGFKLMIDGVQLTPVGGFNGSDIQAFSLSQLHEGEITYERVAAFLIYSDINLINNSMCVPVNIAGVQGFSKTVEIDTKVTSASNRHIVINSAGDMLSAEKVFDCCGEFQVATFEFLFAARCDMEKLPCEFSGFRNWDGWLTLGKSFSPVANVTFTTAEDGMGKVMVEPKHEKLAKLIEKDLNYLSSIIFPSAI